MKIKSWKFAFIVSIFLLLVSNIYWFLQVLGQSISEEYVSRDNYYKGQVIQTLGQLIVKGSGGYTKKDVLHLLRQSNKEAFIVDEDNKLIFENVTFIFEDDKLVKVQE